MSTFLTELSTLTGTPLFWFVFVPLVLVLLCLWAECHERGKSMEKADATIKGLETLDPALAQAFPFVDLYGYHEKGVISRATVRRLAEVKRGRDKYTANTSELDTALAMLTEARKEAAE